MKELILYITFNVIFFAGLSHIIECWLPRLVRKLKGKGKMPVAVSTNTTKKYDLTTLSGAYVVVRRMTYGERLLRSEMATRLSVSGAKSDDFKGELDIQTVDIALWDFANLVIEHNLTDVDERPLDFRKTGDVKKLMGNVGDEVGKFIDKWNDTEGSEEVKN